MAWLAAGWSRGQEAGTAVTFEYQQTSDGPELVDSSARRLSDLPAEHVL